MDRQSASCLARWDCRALGHPDLVARMVRAGAVVSVLAADLHVAAAVLDRLPGPSLVGVHVPAVRLASSLAFGTSRHSKDGHSFGYGAWAQLPEYCCLGPLRCLPPTIANCRGSVEIRPIDQTFIRHMSTIMSREFCWPRWLPRETRDPHLRALSKLMVASQRGEAENSCALVGELVRGTDADLFGAGARVDARPARRCGDRETSIHGGIVFRPCSSSSS